MPQTQQSQQSQQPASDAGWTPRDRQLMSNLPYRQVVLPDAYRRQFVQTLPNDAAGTILIDTENKFLYYLLPQGKAIRYGIIVGEQGQAWSGTARIGRKVCSDRQIGQDIALDRGLRPRRSGCITMFWQPRSPTSWRASRGRSWPKGAITKRAS